MSSTSGIGNNTANNIDDFIKSYGKTTTDVQKEEQRTSDKDIFLNLLVTQMQYQDPLEPQDNSEYLSQMAQFTTLEIMENMSFSSEMTQANTMIGKVVSATDADGDLVVGTVDGVKVMSGEVYLRMGDKDIELGKVQAVTGTGKAEGEILDYTRLTYANSLVGKIVSGKQKSESIVDGQKVVKDAEFKAVVQSSRIDEKGNLVLDACKIDDGEKITISLDEINEVTEMIPAEEDILAYVKDMYDILKATNSSANDLEEELTDVTE